MIYYHVVLKKRNADDDNNNKDLDTTALNMSLEQVFILSSAHFYPRGENRIVDVTSIRFGKVDILE